MGLFSGSFAAAAVEQGSAISALRAAAMRRLRSETRLRAQCGAGYSLYGQKVTKEPPGTCSDEHRSGAPSRFAHLPLTGGVGPDRFYGGRQLGRLVQLIAKARVAQTDCFSLVFRCRFVVAKSACLRFRLTAKTALASLLFFSNANPLRWALRWGPPSAAYMTRLRGPGTPLFESAFVAVGLKYGSGKRRTRATLRFSRRARCPHRAVLGRPGVPPLRRETKPDSASGTGDREGRPYGFTRAYLKPWRAGLGPAPTADTEAVLSFRRGRTLAGPQIYAARPGGRALQTENPPLRAATWGRPYGE